MVAGAVALVILQTVRLVMPAVQVAQEVQAAAVEVAVRKQHEQVAQVALAVF